MELDYHQLLWLTYKAEHPRQQKKMTELELRIAGLQWTGSSTFPNPAQKTKKENEKDKRQIL